MDRYAYWTAALAGTFGAITEADPQPGFYRMKSAGGIWIPVAIWEEDSIGWIQVGKEPPTCEGPPACATWLRCAKYPVTEDAYRHAVATGQWPGEAPASDAGIGHNAPPEGFDAFAQWLEEEANKALAWLKGRKIETQADADRCEKMANDFLAARKRAEMDHKAAKAPFLEGGRKVDAQFKPLIDRASDVARAMKAAVTGYLAARQREKQEAAAKAIAAGEEAAARVETRATTSGTSGKKLSLLTYTSAVVEDWEAATLFFKDNPDLRAVVQRLADKCAQVGAPAPGTKVVTEQRAA